MASPWVFDKSLADAAVDFFPRHLRLTTAEWTDKPFHLAEWQAHHTRQIFGWRRRSNGTRRYRRVRGWVPKKNGKTEWFAGIGHLLTIGDNEPGAEVFAHAANKDQASIIWSRASRMVELDRLRQGGAPAPGSLSYYYEASKSVLFCPHLMSAFKPISGEASGKHGPSIHGALGDEAHEWENGDLHQALVDGMAGRRQPLDAIFSTAGKIKTYAHSLYLETLAILKNPDIDPECYVFDYSADEKADWTDPKVWAQANPNFPFSPKEDFIASQCRAALKSPRLENDFKRMHLGIWTQQTTRWFAMHLWSKNTRKPKDQNYWKRLAEAMRGRKCYYGVDLASTSDFTCTVKVFPPMKRGERVVLIPRFWVPKETIEANDSAAIPYKYWRSIGAIEETPGAVTDYDFIERAILKDCDQFPPFRPQPMDDGRPRGGIAIDRWNATQVAVHLMNEGLPVVLFGQGFASMSAPSKELERLYTSGQLEHGNHPVLEFNFGNAACTRDAADNIKPDKFKAANKIDGVVGAVEGIGLMQAGGAELDLSEFLKNPIIG